MLEPPSAADLAAKDEHGRPALAFPLGIDRPIYRAPVLFSGCDPDGTMDSYPVEFALGHRGGQAGVYELQLALHVRLPRALEPVDIPLEPGRRVRRAGLTAQVEKVSAKRVTLRVEAGIGRLRGVYGLGPDGSAELYSIYLHGTPMAGATVRALGAPAAKLVAVLASTEHVQRCMRWTLSR